MKEKREFIQAIKKQLIILDKTFLKMEQDFVEGREDIFRQNLGAIRDGSINVTHYALEVIELLNRK